VQSAGRTRERGEALKLNNFLGLARGRVVGVAYITINYIDVPAMQRLPSCPARAVWGDSSSSVETIGDRVQVRRMDCAGVCDGDGHLETGCELLFSLET